MAMYPTGRRKWAGMARLIRLDRGPRQYAIHLHRHERPNGWTYRVHPGRWKLMFRPPGGSDDQTRTLFARTLSGAVYAMHVASA